MEELTYDGGEPALWWFAGKDMTSGVTQRDETHPVNDRGSN